MCVDWVGMVVGLLWNWVSCCGLLDYGDVRGFFWCESDGVWGFYFLDDLWWWWLLCVGGGGEGKCWGDCYF